MLDDFRLRKALPTINYLREQGARVILLSHLSGEREHSLRSVAEALERLLGVKIKFLDDCLSEGVEREAEKMRGGEVILLENLRFHPEEEKNDPVFAKKLARLGELFLNDAFGVCHREHASIVQLPQHLPSGAGLLMEKEIQVLSKIANHPWHPLVLIIGGIKIESKIRGVERFLEKADNLLLGGEIANVILRAKRITVSQPLPPARIIKRVEPLKLTDPKLHLPVDVVASPDKTADLYTRVAGPAAVRRDEFILDIGPETINIFKEIIKKAKMIIWSGPLGLFEKPAFSRGTREVGDRIARNYKAFKVAGGGDTVLALREFHLRERFDFISTGGGAMLRFLAGDKLPGIEALG